MLDIILTGLMAAPFAIAATLCLLTAGYGFFVVMLERGDWSWANWIALSSFTLVGLILLSYSIHMLRG